MAERASEYIKGPDVMSKSERTQQRYRKATAGQQSLTQFNFAVASGSTPALSTRTPSSSAPIIIRGSDSDPDSDTPKIIPRVRMASQSPEPPEQIDEVFVGDDPDEGDNSVPPSTSSAVQSDDDGEVAVGIEPLDPSLEKEVEDEIEQMMAAERDEDEAEAWEKELDENIHNPGVATKSWDELRKQVKEQLKKHSKTLPLRQSNQLMIISNFATLLLKGLTRIQASIEIARQWHEKQGTWFARRVRALARHYQNFEQLPRERRGGARSSRSFLHDETVKTAVLQFLRALPTGKVTPRALANQINNTIFPALGISPKNPLSIRTARRWLIKLGWRHTLIKKGVYMDGHERADVVHYREDVFLPLMAAFEARMVHYEGPELKRVEPVLPPGVKEIIPQFHDECCFHANDQSNTAW